MTMDSNYSNWSSSDGASEKSARQLDTVSRNVNFADFDQARQASMQGSTASSLLPGLEVAAATAQNISSPAAVADGSGLSGTPATAGGEVPSQLASTDAQSLASLDNRINATAFSDIYNAARSDSLTQFSSFLPAFMSDAAPALSQANSTSNLVSDIGQFARPGASNQASDFPQYSFNFAPQQQTNPAAQADASQLNSLATQFQTQAVGDIQTGAASFTTPQFNSFLQNLSSHYTTDLTGISSTPVGVPPEQPVPVAPTPTPEQPVPVTPTPTPEQPVPVAPTPTPEQPVPTTPPGSPTTGSPGQGLYVDGKLTGMQPDVNLSKATDLGKLGNLAGVNTSPGWNPSDKGDVVDAVSDGNNGTFAVTVKNPWNQNGHKGSYTVNIPIPNEGLAALEAQASKTNSDGKVIIEDTANGTYYDFWEAQNIAARGKSGGTASTFFQGQLDDNGTPGSNAAGISEALADTSVASGTHMVLFDAPTNWMSPGNPELMAGSKTSDVSAPGGALQEGDILQLPEAVAKAWIAANPHATAAQLQIIKDMEPTSAGGGGGAVVTSQDGTGWSGDESAGLWQANGGVDLTFMNNSNGPDILSNLEVYK